MADDSNPATKVLVKDSDEHRKLLEYVRQRIWFSERKMRAFHARWTSNERRAQAYITLKDYEQVLKAQNDAGGPPEVVNIVVPYSYATIATAVTYQLHTFAGRSPIFQVNSNDPARTEAAGVMELKLQYDCEHSRFVKWLFQFLNDAGIYGIGIFRTEYQTKQAMRTVAMETPDTIGVYGRLAPAGPQKSREKRVVYQGSLIESVDPFMFFPDPRVPMSEVNKKGEFVFWRSFLGRHTLKIGEADGIYTNIDDIPDKVAVNDRGDLGGRDPSGFSSRSSITGGDPHAGSDIEFFKEIDGIKKRPAIYQIDEGTIELIPSEMGLGDSDRPEKWLLTIANMSQIIRAQRYDADHDMHPVCVAEPATTGYAFGAPGMADYIAPLQDIMSWLVNSHMENVRNAVNNMFVVDPSMIEMQDLKYDPKGGRLIRLKRSSFGGDVRQAISQLEVNDVTRGHIADLPLIMRLADAITGVSDNQRALQDAGGRKTATEVRVSSDAGASRLAATTRVISAQAIVDLAAQMSLDNQQFLTTEFAVMVMGMDAVKHPIMVSAGAISGDFYYPIHDGTLPIDRVAMLDIWRELFGQLVGIPPLAAQYDLTKIFEWIATLGGARNIEQFKLQQLQAPAPAPPAQVAVQPDEQVAAGVQAGNLVPMPGAGTMLGSRVEQRPGLASAGNVQPS